MDAGVNLMAAAVIAGLVLLVVASQLAGWLHTRRLDHFAPWIPTIIGLIAAALMTMFYFGMENRRPIVFIGTFLALVMLPWVVILAIYGPGEWRDSSRRRAEALAEAAPVVTDLTAGVLDAAEAKLAAYPDGTTVTTIRYAGAAVAAELLKAEWGGKLPALTQIAGHKGVLIESGGLISFQFQDNTRVVRVTGADRAAVERRLARPSPEKPLTKRQLTALFSGIFVYGLFVSWVFLRLATWAATFPALAGVEPLAPGNLRNRLLGVNRQAVPFTVAPGDRTDELIAEWRYADARWIDQMRAHGLRELIRYRLRLDEASHTVRVLEYRSSFDASAGIGGADLSFRMQRGITFYEEQRQTVLGLHVKDGWVTPDASYSWRFSLDELRQPLIKIITGAGWNWRQVLLDLPWLTG